MIQSFTKRTLPCHGQHSCVRRHGLDWETCVANQHGGNLPIQQKWCRADGQAPLDMQCNEERNLQLAVVSARRRAFDVCSVGRRQLCKDCVKLSHTSCHQRWIEKEQSARISTTMQTQRHAAMMSAKAGLFVVATGRKNLKEQSCSTNTNG